MKDFAALLSFLGRYQILAVGLVLTALLVSLLLMGQGTLLTVVLLTASLLTLLLRSRALVLYAMLGYLTLMGDVRRIRDLIVPRPPADILLLVVPIVVIVIAVPLLQNLLLKDPLSHCMFWLLVIMSLEVVNPIQGGLSVGLTGGLFYIIPCLWFWIGREYGSISVVRTFLYKVFLPLSLLVAALGLYQNFVGFLPWEQAWIDAHKATFVILNLGGGNSRSFGCFASPAEYLTFLSMAASAAAAAWFTSKRIWSAAFPLLTAATFLASGRGVIFKMVFALVLLIALKKTKKMTFVSTLRIILLLAIGFGSLSVIASHFAPSGDATTARTTAQAAIAHQTAGLANPFDSKKSTAGLHTQMFVEGIVSGLKHPLGVGIGFQTGAAAKFGSGSTGSTDGPSGSTEVDISDMFLATGFSGGFLYIAVIVLVLRACLTYLRRVPTEVGYPVAVIIVSGVGTWLTGGQYSTCAIWMFLIGCVAKEQRDRVVSPKERTSASSAFDVNATTTISLPVQS